MANHAVIRTDRMAGTRLESELRSLRYVVVAGSVKTPTDIDNGNVVKLTALEAGQREVYEAVVPAANTKLDEIVLVATPEVMYDERKKDLADFYNEAGKIARGYKLHKNDCFSVTYDALEGTPTVGKLVELMAGTKMKVVASATSGSTQVGKVIALENDGRRDLAVIEVI